MEYVPQKYFKDKPVRTKASMLSGVSTGSLYDIGSGLSSLASGFASLQAARLDAQQFKIQEQFLNLQANAQKLKSRENAVFLREKFLKTISSARVNFAKRGVSMGSGIGRQFVIESMENLAEDIKANELNSQAIQNTLTLQMGQANIAQRYARSMGLLESGISLGKGLGSLGESFRSLLTTKNVGGKSGSSTKAS